jgi:uncharacterized protein YfaS (alpha-2-macroglobulin family)
MREVRRGHTIRLRVAHYADGTLAAPDTYTVEVEGPDGTNVVDEQDMTEESTGYYYYDYTAGASVPTGVYKVDYKLTTGTFVAGPPEREFFHVVKEVG